MEAEVSRFRFSVHQQAGNRIQLKAHVGANRTDRRLVPESGTNVVPQSLQIETESIAERVAAIEEDHRTETAPDVGAEFGRKIQKREAADRQSCGAQRRDFVPAPPAKIGGATKEVALEKRDLQLGRPERVDASRSRLGRSDEPTGQRSEQAQLARDLVVIPGAPQPFAGLFKMKGGDIALFGIEQVVGRVPAAIEADRGSRPPSGAEPWIEAERDTPL